MLSKDIQSTYHLLAELPNKYTLIINHYGKKCFVVARYGVI